MSSLFVHFAGAETFSGSEHGKQYLMGGVLVGIIVQHFKLQIGHCFLIVFQREASHAG